MSAADPFGRQTPFYSSPWADPRTHAPTLQSFRSLREVHFGPHWVMSKHSAGARVILHRTKVSMWAFPSPRLNTIWAVSHDKAKIIYCSTTCVKILISATRNINPLRASSFSRILFCFIFQRYSFNLWDAGKHWLKVSSGFHSRDMCVTCQEKMGKESYLEIGISRTQHGKF